MIKKKEVVDDAFEDDDEEQEEETEAEEIKEVEKKETKKERWSVGQVAKETEDVLVDNTTGKAYNELVGITMIMNALEEIKKLLK